jgi:hypothetical protein
MKPEDKAVVQQALDAFEKLSLTEDDEWARDYMHTQATALRQLLEQPVQEPVAEVKAKMTGGNVGIATVIHEIYSPYREPLQPGDKLYAGYRWLGWDIEQVWSERIFGIDMRFENVQDAIKFRAKLDEAIAKPTQPPDHFAGAGKVMPPAQPADHCEDVLHMVRPQNCGTGYCSCIECPFKKGGA